MTKDQVVVGDKVEEPDVQLLCVVALTIKENQQSINILWLILSLRLSTFLTHTCTPAGPTFALRRSRTTLIPVDDSSLLGMLCRYAQTHTSHRCWSRFTWYISAQTNTAMACSTLAGQTERQHCVKSFEFTYLPGVEAALI